MKQSNSNNRDSCPDLQTYRDIFNGSGAAIMVTAMDGTILSVNPAFCEVTGYEAVEVVGRKPSMMKSDRHGPAFYRDMWSRILEQGKWEGEVWDRRKNGREYPKWLSIRRLDDPHRNGTGFVAVFNDISEMKKSQEFLKFLARHDALTRLPNRLAFAEHVNRLLTGSRASSRELAILFIDLDGFKGINDRLGHFAGDRLLTLVGGRLSGCLKRGDMVARHGGDEFVIVLDGLSRKAAVAGIVERILSAIRTPFQLSGGEVQVDASVGIARYPEDGTELVALLREADRAMYAAKLSKRNSYQFAGELNR